MRKKVSMSLWLMPQGAVYRKLKSITDRLSKKFGAPEIRPHVTLIGGFSGDMERAAEKAEGLAEKLESFTVKFSRIGYKEEFFRCLFLAGKKTPELMKARRKACETFSLPVNDFFPHLSLLYGKFSEKTKKKIIEGLGKNFSAPFKANKIHLVINNEREKVWPEIAAFPIK